MVKRGLTAVNNTERRRGEGGVSKLRSKDEVCNPTLRNRRPFKPGDEIIMWKGIFPCSAVGCVEAASNATASEDGAQLMLTSVVA